MDSFNFNNETSWPALKTTSARKKTINYNNAIERHGTALLTAVKGNLSPHNTIPLQPELFNYVLIPNHNQFFQNEVPNADLANTQGKSEIEDTRTREEILLERKKRYKERKTQARILKYEEVRLKNIERNKSKGISIIDRETMNNMLSLSSNKSCNTTYFNNNNESVSSKTNSAKHIRANDPMKIEIASIIKPKNVKPKLNLVINREQESITGNSLDSDKPPLQRGKKYENKSKPVTKLKKIVLQARNERTHAIDAYKDCPKIKEDIMKDNLSVELEKICIRKKCEKISQNTRQITTLMNDNSDPNYLPELKTALENLITALFGFQDRAYNKNPIKANMRRRYVAGFREVLKSIKLNNACMILLASDIEIINGEGGIMDIVKEICCITAESGVPVICALKRKEIGYLTYKRVGVSCLAILNKDGAEELFKLCLELQSKAGLNNKYLKFIDIKDGEK